jgi:hypothetical protein
MVSARDPKNRMQERVNLLLKGCSADVARQMLAIQECMRSGQGRPVGCQKSIVAVTSSNRLMTGYVRCRLLALVGGGLCGLVVRLSGATPQP